MTRSSRQISLWSGLDRSILATILFLMMVGIVLAFAASPAVSSADDPWFFLKRQVAFATAGLAVLAITSALNITGVRRMSGLALLFSLIMLALVLLVGAELNGAQRWILIGGFSLQPSEILKPAFVVFVAWLFSEEDKGAPVPGRIAAFIIFTLAAGLLLLQPDFGQTVLIALTFGAMMWAGGLSWTYTAILAGLGAAGATGAYFTLPHVRARIESFLSDGDAGGGRTQTDIAIDAIANGGFWGTGPGEGQIKHILPMANTDYVFSVAAEEFGLIVSLTIIGLYGLLFARAWMLALRLEDPFSQLAASGLALLFGLQALVNIAVNLDIAPPTGMTLPFISYGGSSMLALCFSAGLLLALTRKRPGAYAPPSSRKALA
ncbi:putative lipid II flippase FtsW [Maricaulaceae bacterium EIL42A08]|nr:putative lipid II flippase FtsW [Maricaulaceae bacterium EIL42A08]